MADRLEVSPRRRRSAENRIGASAHYAGRRCTTSPPSDSASRRTRRLDVYRSHGRLLPRAGELDERVTIEHFDVPYEGDGLPAWFARTPAADGVRSPVVVFFNGFDGNKELNWFLRHRGLLRRGHLGALRRQPRGRRGDPVPRHPAALRLRSRGHRGARLPRDRDDVDADRIGIMALSLGGYYASRSASMEHRGSRPASPGARSGTTTASGRSASRRRSTSSCRCPGSTSPGAPARARPMEALDAIEGFELDGVVAATCGARTCSCHGEDDQQVPVADAHGLFDACGIGTRRSACSRTRREEPSTATWTTCRSPFRTSSTGSATASARWEDSGSWDVVAVRSSAHGGGRPQWSKSS